ncbi:MAG: glutamyl-tRNA reductase [Cytophagales bacterium]|nr:glutamyl-tRNA reductase [Bernardetiaceae bacterium]MDW8205580.1 glutamyl-tRNA reductase [Cytophagales bacterium]
MFENFKAVILTYKTAPIAIREKVALSEPQARRLLQRLKDTLGLSEALVISTCNRTEIYYSAEQNLGREIIAQLCLEKNQLSVHELMPYFIVEDRHETTVMHLFRVGIGLESQVVGDLQISHQVKQAYQWSADEGMAGPFLHRLMHTIFFTNKRVFQETAFRSGAASVSYAAVEMMEELTAGNHAPTVLVIGLGEIGSDVVRNLKDRRFAKVWLANRTRAKAETLAQDTAFEVIHFDQWENYLPQADVVICSVATSSPLITASAVQPQSGKFQYFFDLAVPRSIAPEIEQLPGCVIYNIDDIHNRANEALQRRIASIPHVERIIGEAIADFNNWTKEMIVSPVINKLKNMLEQIRKEEIARYMKHLDAEEVEKVEQITKSMMQKIIKMPVLQLKAACKRGEAETLADVLNDLFNLEKIPIEH